MTVNPYASPRAPLEEGPRPGREIRTVVLGFRLLGWGGAIVCVLMAAGSWNALVSPLSRGTSHSRIAGTGQSDAIGSNLRQSGSRGAGPSFLVPADDIKILKT